MLRLLALLAVIVAVAAVPLSQNLWRYGGQFALEDHDHAAPMVTATRLPPARTVSVMFVGNSLTFVRDVPGMLANLAASDPGNTTQLRVKAFTSADATLEALRSSSGAIAYAQANHVDDVVLQPHSYWFQGDGGYATTAQEVWLWKNVLESATTAVVLFETWADENGSSNFRNPNDPDNAHHVWALTNEACAKLSQDDHVAMAPVGDAFYLATTRADAPEVYSPDHHHASEAGAYLAALVWYRWLTGRDGSAATYRPLDMSQAAAAALVKVEQDTAAASPGWFPRG